MTQLTLFEPALSAVVMHDPAPDRSILWDMRLHGQWWRAVAHCGMVWLYCCRRLADRYCGDLERILEVPEGTGPEQAADLIERGEYRMEWPRWCA